MENKVLAKVNGKEITSQDIELFIQHLGPQRAQQFQSEEGRQYLLQELINQNLFLAEAIDINLEESDEFKAEYLKFRDSILTQVNMNRLFAGIEVSEDEMNEYFETNKGRYNQPASANTSHILVETEEECKNIYDKIMNNEIDFPQAAREYSKCPSSQNGGNLGMYPKGQMVPEYDNAAFAMKVGEISQPVKTQFGYHIIRLEDKTEGKELSFAEVKEAIYKDLFALKQREVYSNKIEELNKKYQVEKF